MPHYADGVEAKVGDIVRGKGYNVKDDNGELIEIVGVVLRVDSHASQCNITLLLPEESLGMFVPTPGSGPSLAGKTGAIIAGPLEYGQADHFVTV